MTITYKGKVDGDVTIRAGGLGGRGRDGWMGFRRWMEVIDVSMVSEAILFRSFDRLVMVRRDERRRGGFNRRWWLFYFLFL